MRPFALEAWFSRWDHAVRHDLAVSDSESWSLSELLALADDGERAAWQEQRFGYTSPRGAPSLRAVIAGLYRGVKADDVLCFAGAGEGIHVAMHALLRRDDHAVVVVPCYQSMETVPLSICDVTGIALDGGRGWALDIEALAAALRPETRLVAINFPNNPTGKVLERDRFEALVALCQARGIWLFSDEVYRAIPHDPEAALPAAVEGYERGISLDVLSKSHGLPGLRIGWIACRDRALLARMEQLKLYLSLCNAGPAEILARIALKAAPRILGRNRALAARNLALLDGFLARHRRWFDWHRPEGGVTCYPRYRGAEGVGAFARRLIGEAGILVMPGEVYRSALLRLPEDHLRIGFGRAGFPENLEALDRYLAT